MTTICQSCRRRVLPWQRRSTLTTIADNQLVWHNKCLNRIGRSMLMNRLCEDDL